MNAHANNFVLVSEEGPDGPAGAMGGDSSAGGALLAPLDFDMAYTRDTCHFGELGHGLGYACHFSD